MVMKASRDLEDLEHDFWHRAEAFLEECQRQGLDVLIYCTWRPASVQARRFRQGRSKALIQRKAGELRSEWERPDLAELLLDVGPQYGPKVTNAGPGQSIHQYRHAFDGAPMREGEIVWGTEDPEDEALWQRYGKIAVDLGLEWAGHWTSFKEYPHVQDPGIDWKKLIGTADLDLTP